MSDIPNLIAAINRDRSLAVEVLSRLPLLINTTGLVRFDLDTPVDVPSIPLLQQEMSAGNIGNRVGDLEALSRGVIQELDRVVTSLDLGRANPYWNPLDLKGNADGDVTDPLFRAQVENGMRLPFDGLSIKQIDRKFTGDAARIGDWMLPNYTETLENRYTSVDDDYRVDIYQYGAVPAFSYSWRTYSYYRYYYGYYYAWWRYRFYGRYYHLSKHHPDLGNATGAMGAQTFQVREEKVLLGFQIAHYRPGTYSAAAKPRLLLVESSYGRPDMERVLATGSFVDDAEYQGSLSTTVYWLTVNLDRPVLLKPKKSYAFVIVADASWTPNYTANQDSTGGFFQTQDGAAWAQDIAKDLAYRLRFAKFGAESVTIGINAMELSGGIASVKQDLLADLPETGTVETEMEVSGQWLPIRQMDSITSLPPHTPMRLVLTGTEYAMPLIDITKSTITAFRPATELQYYSKTRRPAKDIRVTYELVGFNADWHVFDPALNMDGTRYSPDLLEYVDSADGKVRSISAVYELPETGDYRHDVKASTKTAAKVFDISSIIEVNA